MQQQIAANYDAKRSVWVPDAEEGFVKAEVRTTKGETHLLVRTTRGEERTLAREEVQAMNPPKFELAGGHNKHRAKGTAPIGRHLNELEELFCQRIWPN